ncbi:MAG TPA: hypothetical protein VHJ38_04215 [Nitrososphaeraceae archaeon]|nr:hypothetical protein [Nitrososphaeraceae archaeon]
MTIRLKLVLKDSIKGSEDTFCDTLLVEPEDRLLGISVFGEVILKLDSTVIKYCTFRSVFVG